MLHADCTPHYMDDEVDHSAYIHGGMSKDTQSPEEDIPIPNVPSALIDFLTKYKTYIIVGHYEPDGDCICSCLALASFLKRHGALVHLLNAGPFAKPEVSDYAELFSPDLSHQALSHIDKEHTGLVVVDCTGLDRVGEKLSTLLKGFPTAIIDHHATNSSHARVGLVLKNSPSTTYLVQAIIEAVDGQVSPHEAALLFFGLSTDTGFFRHLDTRSANVFRATARLIDAGANPKATFIKMNGGKSFDSRIVLANILSRLQSYYDGRLMISYETNEDVQKYGAYSRDSDLTYMTIQGIKNVEAIVLLRQEKLTHCSIGFRSLDKIDVSVVAKQFGGGGHVQASGAYVEGSIETLIPQIVESFKNQFT